MRSKFYEIYALVCPLTHVVRYVGRTRRGAVHRVREHLGGQCPLTAVWIKSLDENPLWVVLEARSERQVPRKNVPGTMWASSLAEIKWMKRFRATLINENPQKAYKTTWDWFCNPDERNTDGQTS